MARVCDLTGKSVMSGNKVSKSYNHTKRRWRVNLLKVKTVIGGESMTLKVSARALRNNWIEKKVRVPRYIRIALEEAAQ